MKIFLAPRSNETSYKNFLSTIENGVDKSIIEPFLDDAGKKVLASIDKIFVWGNKEAKKSSWEKMSANDVVLFYKGREGNEKEGKFLYAGKLLYKQHSRDLGLALWPPKTGEEPWTCVFFLKELRPIYMPMSDIQRFGGYEVTFDRIQGFMPLNENGNKVILNKFGSVDAFLSNYGVTEDKSVIESDLEEKNEITAHAEAEMLLLKIGRMLGYDTFSPNKSNEAFGEVLQDYISLKELPTRFLGSDIVKLVSQIDVLWFKDEVPKYAFEVEHSTKIISGLQRLCQLMPLSAKLFIIASGKDFYLYEKYINTDPYYKYKTDFKFREYKQLENFFKAVSEFTAINETFLK
ncbi:MAG: hypothetical protein UT13_C0001G0366 [Candidatus Pacebacteria bacterium GW2011_GWF2_38_9]|nr:MAG: hypothetical protein US01_C0001G0376 [candidate division TM6 bacterium GW2011_GWF2_28_16]KKQ08473.1 MAG: hypothetical protein US20_C0016G0018 [Candidatus Pacebacteria bacterium GW2011_GWF1_36_5]KKQ88719.1 MAG: hypothetical protein UT13_C0001G0366 [Candidatus Pacebacteria bacterium GW2011_GWF2_38_9]HAZ73748.1 hypothetical protein [Candidatus Paceibacterota bacterium]